MSRPEVFVSMNNITDKPEPGQLLWIATGDGHYVRLREKYGKWLDSCCSEDRMYCQAES